MTSKEINQLIDNLAYGNEDKLYDLRCELRIVHPDLTLEEAQARIQSTEPELRHLYTITSSSQYTRYTEDLNLCLVAAKRISEKNDYTFVLSIEDGIWKAAYGNAWDHADHTDENPAYAVCMSILKFCGKV
jgi:hypothetical protein